VLYSMDNSQVSGNLIGHTPSVDAIQEFSMTTKNALAEFGNFQRAIISTTIKSGTNSLRGSVFWFFRNDALNANRWEGNWACAPDNRPKDKMRSNTRDRNDPGPELVRGTQAPLPHGEVITACTQAGRVAACGVRSASADCSFGMGAVSSGFVQMSVGSHIHTRGMAKGQTYPPPRPGFSGSRLLLNSFQRLDNDLRWDSPNVPAAL
jgi:hypothetical protein